VRLFLLGIAAVLAGAPLHGQAPQAVPRFPVDGDGPRIAGPARPGAYLGEVGRRAALFGDETGAFEVWTWPVKLVRDLRLAFRIPDYDQPIPGATVAREVVVRDVGHTVTYSHATFTVRQHLLVPEDEPGVIILLDVETVRPLEVLVQMHADFNLAWPGGFGGGNIAWVEEAKAFRLAQGGTRQYYALVGSPFAVAGTSHPAHDAPMIPSQFTLRFDPAATATGFIPVVIAGGAMPRDSALAVYRRLLGDAGRYWEEKTTAHRKAAQTWLALDSPDPALDSALAWGLVNLHRQRVCNPDLGCGLVAGFGRAGAGNFRPGFGWYFGGDASINSLAMTAVGQRETVREGLAFLARYQREDGKIPHEISHAAKRLPWFTEYPYTWFHGDTTPFWLLACASYWRASADTGFLRETWPAIVKAFRWSAATDGDGDGLMENPKAGAGAIEVGGLDADGLTDIYLAGVWVAALDGVAAMAEASGDAGVERDARALGSRARSALDRQFWNESRGLYAFALLVGGTPQAPRLNDALTVWPATAMAFGLLDPERADRMLREMSSSLLTTDWGMRMLARTHPLYEPLHYNNGAVWPFVTGFGALAHYRYHRGWAGHELIRAVARTTFDFSRGRQPELMSGAFYQLLDTSVPDQFFASSMLVGPLARGLLGLDADAAGCRLTVAPHLPAEWDRASVRNVDVGCARLDLQIERGARTLRVRLTRESGRPTTVRLSPALPLGASLEGVTVNGASVQVTARETPHDLHADLETTLDTAITAEYRFRSGLEVAAPLHHPSPGDPSTGLRILDWRKVADGFLLSVEGLAGREYTVDLHGSQPVGTFEGAEGAEVARGGRGRVRLRVRIPDGTGFQRREVRLVTRPTP
jgi:hypothetical protein